MSALYDSHRLPAGSKCIQVLDVFGVSSSSADEPVQGRLRVIPIHGTQKFTALPYVWGYCAITPQHIVCEDTQVKIKSNCHSALCHLRRALGNLTIWIDAICINQDDASGKYSQIPLMGDIYSTAKTFYVWLGDGTPETSRVMDYMGNPVLSPYCRPQEYGTVRSSPFAAAWFLFWSKYSVRNHPVPFDYRYMVTSTIPLVALFYKAMAPLSKPRFGVRHPYAVFSDIQELLKRPWIKRLWTIQEILLASNPVVVCGDRHIPWKVFKLGVFFLEKNEDFNSKSITLPWLNFSLGREQILDYGFLIQRFVPTVVNPYLGFMMKVMRAKKHIFIMFGLLRLSCSLSLLVPFTVLLRRDNWGALGVASLMLYSVIWWPVIYGVNKTWLLYLRNPPHLTNESFTLALYSHSAQDPKDMAFGMWTVLKRGGKLSLPPPNAFLSLGHLYRVFAIHLVHMTERLDLLHIAAVKGTINQPSWVPDSAAHEKDE